MYNNNHRISDRNIKVENYGIGETVKDNEKSERQRKRKNMEEFVEQKKNERMRKRQRFMRFQEEIMEESNSEEAQEDEEEILEDLEKEMEIKELSRLYIKAYKREMGKEKLNRN